MSDRGCSTCAHGVQVFEGGRAVRNCTVPLPHVSGCFEQCWEPRLDSMEQVARDMLNTIDESACRGMPVDVWTPAMFSRRLRELGIA